MILGLLKIIFIFIFVLILLGAMAVFGFLRSILKIRRHFSDMADKPYGRNGGSTANTDKETVIDKRSDKEAGRKIFSKDEGEYVDFKDVP